MYVTVSMNSVNSVKSVNINISQKGLQQQPDTNPPLGGRFARLGAVALNSEFLSGSHVNVATDNHGGPGMSRSS